MENEYLEMRGKELFIDGICIAEVTNIEDAMALSDRVSNYVAELQRKIEKLESQLSVTYKTGLPKDERNLTPYAWDENEDADIDNTMWVAPYDVD